MRQELQPCARQSGHHIPLNPARDLHGVKSAVGGRDAVEGAGATFGEEGGGVGGVRGEDLVGFGEGGPGGAGAGAARRGKDCQATIEEGVLFVVRESCAGVGGGGGGSL